MFQAVPRDILICTIWVKFTSKQFSKRFQSWHIVSTSFLRKVQQIFARMNVIQETILSSSGLSFQHKGFFLCIQTCLQYEKVTSLQLISRLQKSSVTKFFSEQLVDLRRSLYRWGKREKAHLLMMLTHMRIFSRTQAIISRQPCKSNWEHRKNPEWGIEMSYIQPLSVFKNVSYFEQDWITDGDASSKILIFKGISKSFQLITSQVFIQSTRSKHGKLFLSPFVFIFKTN